MTFERFDEIDNFVKGHSSKVILAKSYNDILTAKQAGKVAIVAGAQDLYTLDPSWEEGDVRNDPLGWAATIGKFTRHKRSLPTITKGGSGLPISPIIPPIFWRRLP